MSRCFRMYTASMNSAQRIFEIIDAVPEILESEEPIRPEYIRGEIELKNVTFGYEANKPVLENISFHVNAGEVLGIVGRSGAGKSTLVNLISRLYDPQEGSILIDGIDIKDMGFEELRRSVAMVSQETYIFMGTVAENIAYAKPDASYEEIVAAAVRASAHDFICKMPDGYDTMLGSSGRTLSGGERQRISIARAILANPRILILDEATASVDTETEQAIQASLEELVKGRTTLSIAHRLSTLNNADYLLVIDDGKIAEQGTHRELIEKKGIFHKLMQLQTKALAMRGIE
ncbi:MAG: ATP-binding cassette domain-containing protein [Lachnospiraceae bacterium]|nr:ATP-binding cassette domain-containing protein [Lachnospiraceae bacterium]